MTTGSIRIAMTSDVGLRRKNNQDTGFAQQGVFMVCDGMGGGKGGEQASQLAAQHFAQLAAMPSRTRQDIDDTLARAQHDILDLGDRLGGVAGTTCSGLVLPQDHADSTSARSAALFSDADDQDFSDQWSMSAIPAPTISVRWRMPMLPPRISFPCGTPLR